MHTRVPDSLRASERCLRRSQRRGEQNRTEQNRTEQNRTEQNAYLGLRPSHLISTLSSVSKQRLPCALVLDL
ncbi:hypothetical protein DL93DRAFT_603924 [Clavulina sp. PMI_390]|nr:hypothetical protein DL93DRAFT_603924 [Clavulina sp. PMI_390]